MSHNETQQRITGKRKGQLMQPISWTPGGSDYEGMTNLISAAMPKGEAFLAVSVAINSNLSRLMVKGIGGERPILGGSSCSSKSLEPIPLPAPDQWRSAVTSHC